MSDQNQMPGAYSKYTCKINKEAQAAFDEALEGKLGVVYEPVAVAQQGVAGMNYKFFCNAKVVGPDAHNSAAIIIIHKPLPGEGKAVVKSIETV